MTFEFSASSPQDLAEVSRLLQKAFGTADDAQAVSPALMQWKYLAPRPDWSGSRGYVMRKDGRLVAHACAYPVTLLTSAGPLRANHMGDWAADPDDPGAGMLIWRHLSELTPVMLTVGGSMATRQMLPRMRYRNTHTSDVYARVVRPWKQFRTDPYPRGWKQPARVLRNIHWSHREEAGHTGWKAQPVARFDDSIAPLLETREPLPFVRAQRSPALLNYYLDCPGAKFEGYLMTADGELRGWFLLARVDHQTRIAEMWVSGTNDADWRSAFSLAMETAAKDPACCEITAASSIDLGRQALASNGFEFREAEPIFLYDREHVLEGANLQLEMIDGDAAFFYNPAYPYLT